MGYKFYAHPGCLTLSPSNMIPPILRPSNRSTRSEAHLSTSAVQASLVNTSELWDLALDEYEKSIGVDLRDDSTGIGRDLSACASTEDIVDALRDTMVALGEKRAGGHVTSTIRRSLKPVVFGLSALLDVGKEVASSSVRVPY